MAFEHEGILIYRIVLHKMRCGLLVLSIRKTPIRSPYKRQARDTEDLFLLDQSQKAFQRWPNVERCRTSTLKWRWILIGFESWMDVETWRCSTLKFQMRRCFNVVIMTFASTLKLWRCFNVETLNNVDIWSADVFNQIQHNFNVGTTSYACWDGFLYMTLYQFNFYMTAINLDRLFAKHFLKLKKDRISVGS